MEEVLLYISLIIVISAILTVIARAIKQPPLIAYILAGIIVGPLALNLIGPSTQSSELMQVLAHIGVAFLLFIVGLNLDLRILKDLGFLSLIAGSAQIIITAFLGYIIALSLGFSTIASIYIAAALAFSSTVVVVKIFSDKKELHTLHGRISLGILIVQDFVAAIALMALPMLEGKGTISTIFLSVGQIIFLIFAVFVIAIFVLHRALDYFARNQEVLFLFGIAWALLLATLFDILGFSLEIGALVAGMSLASSKYTRDLGGKIKPLRDFFIVLFFVFFGSQLASSLNWPILQKALILSLFVLIGKPIIVMLILKIAGYTKRINFLVGISLAQISEFSLILAMLGFSLGHLTQEIMSLSILTAIITIGISSYSLYFANPIFNKISNFLNIFEGKKQKEKKKAQKDYEIILIGYHRIGFKLLQTIKKLKVPFLVVDYNPQVLMALEKEGIDCLYGDAGDKEFLSEIGLKKAKLIISTIPDESSNLTILEALERENSKATFIATAEQPRDALDLYFKGIDYVLVPHHLGGDFASHMIAKFKTNKKLYDKAGKSHFRELQKGKNDSAFN